MQEQEGISQPADYDMPEARPANVDVREQQRKQRQWQDDREYQDDHYAEERSYEEGYVAQNAGDAWFRADEKLRPRQKSGQRGLGWLLLLLVVVCALLIVGTIAGFILSWLSWSLLTCLVIVGAYVVIMQWRVVVQPEPMRTFQVMEHAQLVVNNTFGTVVLRRGDDTVVTVAAIKRASGIGINFERMQALYNQQGDRISVSTRVGWNVFQLGIRRIDLEITVPEQCDVELSNGSGRIFAGDIQGVIRLRTGSGRIEASNVRGQVALKTGSGPVAVNGLSGQLQCVTGSGRIAIGQAMLTGISNVRTGSGSISFAGGLDARGQYEFKTGSGSLRFLLPFDAAVNVRAKTGSGKIVNEFATAGAGNGPRAQLSMKTGSGSIYVQKERYTF